MTKTTAQITKQYNKLSVKNEKNWDKLRTAAIKSRNSKLDPGVVARRKVASRQTKIDSAYIGLLNVAAAGGDRYAKAWVTRIAKYGTAGFSARGLKVLVGHG